MTTSDDDREFGAPDGEFAGDSLPEDLDVTAYVGPYTFPDIKRRRVAGTIYAVLAALCLWAALATHNTGFTLATVLLGVTAAYHFIAAWPLRIEQTEALAVASRTVGFPVGHASAQLAWRGLRSRPTWRILLYSSENPPQKRGMVLIDGRTAAVLGDYVEDNPEDPSIWKNA